MNFRTRLTSLHRMLALPLAFCVALGAVAPVHAAQVLRNLVAVEGMRDNPLVGYGLVVGLNGGGDSTQVKFASQSAGWLTRFFNGPLMPF